MPWWNKEDKSGNAVDVILRESDYHVYLDTIVTAWPHDVGARRGFTGNPFEWEDRLIDLMDLRRLKRV